MSKAEVEDLQDQEQGEGEGEGEAQNSKEALIRCSDMQPDEECSMIAIANSAIEQFADVTGVFQTQKFSKMAGSIKRQMDNKHGPGWFVIVGKNYGSYVTHEMGTFLHFSFDDLHITLFRAR